MGRAKNYRSKKRKFTGNRFTNSSVKSDTRTVPETSVADGLLKATASSSKLESTKIDDKNTNDSELNGNRIINVNILISVLATLCCPICFCDNLVLNEDSRFGLCSNFCIKCKNCSFMKGFCSTIKEDNKNQLNTLVVVALRLIGKGFNGGRKLFCLLDLPFLSKNTFRRQEIKINQIVSDTAKENMIISANDVISLKNSQRDISKCGVSMDGTWQKRGYSSLNGCVSCISVDTGKILDIEVMSSFCRVCNEKRQSKKHVCRNHQGSSSSMETVGAYRIFERSEVSRSLQYTEYYGDGDSKAYDAVRNMYGLNTVTKLECIGHVQKRVGSRLRKLKKSRKGLGGKGKLTDSFIDKLQNYYGIAIRSNINNLQNMMSAVIAALYHSCSSAKHPMHNQCPKGVDSWCRYQQAIARNKKYSGKEIGLPQEIINIIKKPYMELCDQELLKKCLHGLTQNANESFNGLLWNIVPKSHFVERQTLTLGTYLAVIQFNEGGCGILSVLKKLNLCIGSYMRSGLKMFDLERITSSKRLSLPSAKLRRKILRAQRKKKKCKV